MAGSLLINSLIFQITVCIVLINETSSYHEFLLEDGNLCKLRDDADDAVIKLGSKESSSKIVTQKTYFASWTGRYNFKCSFQVKAHSDYGIYAVIQALNFRKNDSTEDCKDYVKFEQPPNLIDKFFNTKVKRSAKYCGKLYASRIPLLYGDEVYDYTDVIAENSYKTFSNSIIVTIYIGTDRLLPHEKLDVKIAFTAFRKDCNPRLSEDYFECSRCEWIWKGLESDKVQNCPFISCRDEDHCKNLDPPEIRDIVVSNGTGTKVTIGAVAAIIVFFITFASCLCVCRKSQRCCWSQPSSNASRMEMNRTRQRNAYEENGTPYGEIPAGPATPSAPPLTDVKDLPPSYDSLFPDK